MRRRSARDRADVPVTRRGPQRRVGDIVGRSQLEIRRRRTSRAYGLSADVASSRRPAACATQLANGAQVTRVLCGKRRAARSANQAVIGWNADWLRESAIRLIRRSVANPDRREEAKSGRAACRVHSSSRGTRRLCCRARTTGSKRCAFQELRVCGEGCLEYGPDTD